MTFYPLVNLGSRHRLGQYEYASENSLVTAQKAYQDAFASRDQARIDKAFDEYKKAYDAYQEEGPVREELEKLDYDSMTALHQQNEERYKELVAKMEDLWPGWHKAHLDWKVYQVTGGQPEWYRKLKEGAASTFNVALQVAPLIPAARGIRIPSGAAAPPSRPPVATPSVAVPKTMPVAAPGIPSVMQPSRYPVVQPSQAQAAAPALAPGRPPSGGGASVTTPAAGGQGAGQQPSGSEFMKAFEKIMPGRTPVPTPSGKPPVPTREFVRWPEGLENVKGYEIQTKRHPETGEYLYDKRLIDRLLVESGKPPLPASMPVPTLPAPGAAPTSAPPAGYGTAPPQVKMPWYIPKWRDPSSGKTFYPIPEMQDLIRKQGEFNVPMPGRLVQPPSKPIGRGIPTVPLPPVASVDTRTAMAPQAGMPASSWGPGAFGGAAGPAAAAEAARAPVGSTMCPSGQFWDGTKCRGAVDPSAAGLISAAGGLGPSGGAQMPVPYGIGMGRRFKVVNL
jgi:hypothetical protein